jgi:hypothetical protein
MTSIIEKITLFPAILMFAISAYLAFLSFIYTESSTKTSLLIYATISFFVGIILIVLWIVSNVIRRGTEND